MSFSALPQIGIGTYRLKGNDARDAVKSALSLGYRHVDTAQMYGNEAEVGDGITSSGIPRREIFLTTKIWYDKLQPSDLINSLHDSLAQLKTNYVNLALIHWPSPDNEVPMEEYLGALRDAQREGLTEHIGISNFNCAQMDKAKSILGEAVIFTNQVEAHPFLANRRVVEHAQKLGITVTGYMPLAVGKVMDNEVLQQIGSQHNASPAQIAIAWLISRGVVPIPSSTRPAHQKANLAALKIRLGDDEIQAINALDCGDRIANPGFSPVWD
ncbi:MAG TPA: 2,5-didehydrogluconate reductase DkgB [Marinobacter sp.]|nr:2,5-didehydrogluconate reductase DkgB [Marinobacter sp.]